MSRWSLAGHLQRVTRPIDEASLLHTGRRQYGSPNAGLMEIECLIIFTVRSNPLYHAEEKVMGLDLVELAMAVEERFNITITDAEAEHATTPARLIDVVLSKVGSGAPASCRTGHAFYAVRRMFASDFGCKRKDVRPDTALEQIVPRAGRRRLWRQMQHELEARDWPGLVRPRWLVLVLSVFVCALLVAAVALFFRGLPLWIGLPLALCSWGAALLLTQPWCVEFPDGRRTVGQLAEFLVMAAPNLFKAQDAGWPRPDVAAVVRSITIETLGLKPGQYREDARFVEDLGGG